ncbi:MAG: TnpV protein [Clostridia bacterium]|nr:TnpV protein [Clostridia bacterium]
MSNKNSINLRQVGNYFIPNLILPPGEASTRLGKWGNLHKDYILKNKKVTVAIMTAESYFWRYLADIDKQATEMFDTLIEQMKNAEGVTEQLKAENQMSWVQKMSNIEARAREIVNKELIYV